MPEVVRSREQRDDNEGKKKKKREMPPQANALRGYSHDALCVCIQHAADKLINHGQLS